MPLERALCRGKPSRAPKLVSTQPARPSPPRFRAAAPRQLVRARSSSEVCLDVGCPCYSQESVGSPIHRGLWDGLKRGLRQPGEHEQPTCTLQFSIMRQGGVTVLVQAACKTVYADNDIVSGQPQLPLPCHTSVAQTLGLDCKPHAGPLLAPGLHATSSGSPRLACLLQHGG